MYVNNIEMPVTCYLSTDNAAPVLTKDNLSIVLKACLVTGYGNKHGAGWTMPYENSAENKRVFATEISGELDSFLRVKDNNDGTSVVQSYRTMRDIDNGDKIIELDNLYKYGKSTVTGRWAVIASSRSCIVWVEGGYDSAGRNGQMLFYGDTASAHDGSRALLLAHSGGEYSDGSTSSLFLFETRQASVKAKSYKDGAAAREQDFLSLFSSPCETAGQYVAPVLMQHANALYAVPGVYTATRADDNLTQIRDEGAEYIVLHSYGWSNLRKDFARLLVRTDKWRY